MFAEDEARVLREAAPTRSELDRLVDRRVAGEPLEAIVGWAEFCGLRVGVEPGVFVPRARTTLLVREAYAAAPGARLVVDLCCGTGAVGLAIAAALGPVELYAVDIEPAAVRCARRNLAGVGGVVLEGDLFSPLPDPIRGRVDILAVNAPYVPSAEIEFMPAEARLHEPLVTLDGGPDGLDVHRAVAARAAEWLSPEGVLLIETSRRQAAATSTVVRAGGLIPRVVKDDEVDGTIVVGARG